MPVGQQTILCSTAKMQTITYNEILRMWLLEIRGLLAFVMYIILKLLEVKCGMSITNDLEIVLFLHHFYILSLTILISLQL